MGALIYPERRESMGRFSQLQMAFSEALHSNATSRLEIGQQRPMFCGAFTLQLLDAAVEASSNQPSAD